MNNYSGGLGNKVLSNQNDFSSCDYTSEYISNKKQKEIRRESRLSIVTFLMKSVT